MGPSSLHGAMLTDIHSWSKLTSAAILPRSDDAVGFWTSGSYNLSTVSFMVAPESWGQVHVVDVSFVTTHSPDTYSLHFA